MAKKLIEAENISKYYKLGVLGAQSFKEDIREWWSKKLKRTEDEEAESKKYIWALRDVSFNLQQGEVLGLVGKNGAGKSTLLKIISRITLPTSGRIFGNGRIASLLEVGTGFHGELTGRENIYLNGHIMGMKKNEIDRKFDEIIDFSGVSRFLDTPVKRYSSGMYVRLAFAVAANLDPEILVIDEVLAVGDSEFQKKCLTKIKTLAKEEGKTILFVSHNMQTLRNTCSRALILENGRMTAFGNTDSILNAYANKSRELFLGTDFTQQDIMPGNDIVRIKRVEMVPEYIGQQSFIDIKTKLAIRVGFDFKAIPGTELSVNIFLFNAGGDLIFEIASMKQSMLNGSLAAETEIPGDFLNDGSYYISVAFFQNDNMQIFKLDNCISFDVEDQNKADAWEGQWAGIIRPSFPVILRQEL
jgi:lipopolysaccharide transport system ATP-binding protein